ncbi:MAG: M15 family metallopeptidase, partial [Actinomycetota bacterium]
VRTRLALLAAALAGALAGGLIMLSLPTSGKMPPATKSGSGKVQQPAGSPRLGKAPITTILAWTPGGLPPGLADSARAIPGVSSVAEVRSGISWLSSWANQGEAPISAPSGKAIPVEVAAVDPEQYVTFVSPADRSRFLELEQGGALLGQTGSTLRGIEAQGSLRFGNSNLSVVGVVADELVGGHEVIVSTATGASAGITTPRYLLISLTEEASRSLVEDELRRALPPGTRVRVRAPGETPVFRHGDAVLSISQIKELFGEFAARPEPDGSIQIDPGWIENNIATTSVPLLGTVRCHKAVLPQLTAALEEISRRGLGGLVRAGDFGGCYSPRFLNRDAETGLSHHAWGIAIDLNVSENPLGAEPSMDSRLVEILERWGFAWGGRWLVPDGMHFEFLRWPLGPKG